MKIRDRLSEKTARMIWICDTTNEEWERVLHHGMKVGVNWNWRVVK